MLFKRDEGYCIKVKGNIETPWLCISDQMTPELHICVLKLDATIFPVAFHSFAFNNWLKEFAREIDESGKPLYPKLTKSVETVILYLKDISVPTAFILKAMASQDEYLDFLIQVDEFGKTIVE